MITSEELKKDFKEVQHVLKNQLIQQTILKYLGNYMDYPKLVESINLYIETFPLVMYHNNEDDFILRMSKHLKHFISNTKDKNKISLYHMELLNDINFFIENRSKKGEDKVKIQEIADEAGLSNADLLDKAKELGLKVKAANSKISMEDAGILVDYAISGTLPKSHAFPKAKTISTKKGTLNLTIDNFKKMYPNIKLTKNNKVRIQNLVDGVDRNYINTIQEAKNLNYNVKSGESILSLDEAERLLDKLEQKRPQEIIFNQDVTNKIDMRDKQQKFSKDKLEYKFPYKNILLKGVPGTGKSRTLENIINNQLNLKEYYNTNVLRINIHSASSNADLMQGIGISSNSNGNIEYKEKQGLILELIERATFNPNQPFVLVLEEIQENSLNELIGDLIYLIEDSKRADGYEADNKEYTYSELINKIMEQNSDINSVKLPSLISRPLLKPQ